MIDGTAACGNYMNRCCTGGRCNSCNSADTGSCTDSTTWHKDGDEEHDCDFVYAKNEAKDWKKKKAKKNCKKKDSVGVKAKKACKCRACNTKTGSIAIAVPVCVAGVFLIAGTFLFFKKKKTKKAQRRLSHRLESMPDVTGLGIEIAK